MSPPTLVRFEAEALDVQSSEPTNDSMQPLGVVTAPPCTAKDPGVPANESCMATATLANTIESTVDVPVLPSRTNCLEPSPISWHPAEEVLPVEPPRNSIQTRELVTYHRRRTTLAREGKATTTTLEEASEVFIANVTCVLLDVLPTPVRQTRRGQQNGASTLAIRSSRRKANLPPEFDLHGQPTAMSSTFAPICSRRVANLLPEFDFSAQVSVAQELGFSKKDQRTSAGKDKYTKFFGNPLCRSHVAALGARIGKVLPKDTQLAAAAIVVSP